VVFSGALALSPGWLWLVAGEGGAPPDKDGGKDRATIALGAELFQREWMPGDERSPGGDGLGPVYNDTSCVACHNLGAPGGGGPVNKNIVLLNVSGVLPTPVGTTTTTTTVEVVTPVAPPRIPPPSERPPALEPMFAFVEAENARLLKEFTGETKGRPSPPRPPVTPTPAPVEAITRLIDPPAPAATLASLTEKLAKVHPGFLTSQSVVLHRFGTNPGYAKWRQDMLGLGGSSGTTTVTTSSGLRGGSKAATVPLT
jgi:hypothetical protein